MAGSYFPKWRLRTSTADGQGQVIATDERLPWPQTFAMGVQHVVAMFGSTVLAPLLMGFDPNLAIFMSGIGTLLFLCWSAAACRAISAPAFPLSAW
ncbi:permease family protein [Collimonas arenae]|nr:permease family protein [Collimonas arenae]